MDLTRLPLFRGIDSTELPELLTCVGGVRRRYEKGDLLLRRGERVTQLGVVLSGGVHIVREDFWGNRTIVGLAGPGDVFGESYACLPGEALEVSVLAAAETEVLLLNAERTFVGCGQGCAFHLQLSKNLLALLAGKNLMLTKKMGHMAQRTTREKLLSYFSAQALAAGGPEFDIPMDRQQLADYLAVERSAMSASLSGLRREGILDFHKHHIHLLRSAEL